MNADISASPGNLPAEPNSFIGRARDLAELARLVGDVRALTLCGPGGIGKTRLAVRLASQLAPAYADGVWLIELAETADPGQVARRVAATVGIGREQGRPEADTLVDALRPRQALLILDTCEHLIGACADLAARLLTGCPRLRVIATSREPLGVRGETAWRVPPLALPDAPDRRDAEAVRLFADRAAAIRPGFAVTDGNLDAVIQICRTLDGVPLAIELAAARMRALSLGQIAARLDDRFALLAVGERTAPPRQQTLQAAMDWSYELLTDAEQVLLRRLSVFAGWDLEMAEQVCADRALPAAQVLRLLTALIDKSLVTVEGEVRGTARYRLLDTIRQYAAVRLAQAGEGPQLRRRHRDYLLGLLESIVARSFRRGDPPWPDRVAFYHSAHDERANFELALSECEQRAEAAEGLRICSGLRATWVVHGDVAHGVEWFDRMLAIDADVPAALRARALMLRAELAFEQQDYPTAADCAERGLRLSRQAADGAAAGALRMLALVDLRAGRLDAALPQAQQAADAAKAAGDDWEEGLALAARAAIFTRQGKAAQAQRSFELALDVLRDNNGWGVALVQYGLGQLARARGDNAAALSHYRAALGLYREVDARPEIARCLGAIGWVALSQGDLELADASVTECVRLALATGHQLAVARGLEELAVLAAARDDPARAARIEGAALALREVIGEVASEQTRIQREELHAVILASLGAPATADLMAEGAEMSPDAAARLGSGPAAPGLRAGKPRRRGDGEHGSGKSRHPGPGTGQPPLTPREQQITALIASGLSNREIATKLFISPATTARHVANIFVKLGVKSRTQVAVWHLDANQAGAAGTNQPGQPGPAGPAGPSWPGTRPRTYPR